MAFCRKFSGRVVSGENHAIQHRLRCKMWSCAYCAVVNAKIWRTRLLKSAVQMMVDNPDTKFAFVTITLPAKYHKTDAQTVEHASKFIQKNWDALSKRLKRWLGQYQYVRVLESHKDGTLHIHVLITAHIPDVIYKMSGRGKNRKRVGNSQVLRGHLEDVGFGYIHDVKNLENRGENPTASALGIIGYVTKYISKSLPIHDAVQRKIRLRKILTSREFIRVDDKKFEDNIEDWYFRFGRLRYAEFLRYKSMRDTRTGIIDDSQFLGEEWIPPDGEE